jgi:hypothetical protein
MFPPKSKKGQKKKKEIPSFWDFSHNPETLKYRKAYLPDVHHHGASICLQLIVEIVSVALDLLHATPLNHGAFLKQARGLGFLFCGCLFVCWFVFLSWGLVVLSILVCMIHHEGEKQASKQASKWVITSCKWVELTVLQAQT